MRHLDRIAPLTPALSRREREFKEASLRDAADGVGAPHPHPLSRRERGIGEASLRDATDGVMAAEV